jgi:hypothetical protein
VGDRTNLLIAGQWIVRRQFSDDLYNRLRPREVWRITLDAECARTNAGGDGDEQPCPTFLCLEALPRANASETV